MERERTKVKKHPIGLKIDPDLLLKVDSTAEKEGRTRSVMISRLVQEALEARERARVPA